MRTLTVTNKELYHTIIRSIIIYLLCLIICVWHIIDVYHTYAEIAVQNQNEQILQSREVLGEYFAWINEIVDQGAQDITDIGDSDTGHYEEILERICRVAGLQETIYVLDDTVYTRSTQMPLDDMRDEWERLKESGLEQIHVVQDFFELNDLLMVFPVHIVQKSGAEGYLIAFYNCTGLLSGGVYETLDLNSQNYLILADGQILDVYNHDDINVNGEDTNNFFVQMLSVSNGGSQSKNRILDMKAKMRSTSEQSISITALNKHSCIINSVKIDGVEDVFLVTVMDKHSQLVNIRQFVMKTVIAMAAILLMTVALIFYIWFSLKGVTRQVERLAYTDDVTKGKNVNFFRKEAMQLLQLNSETPYLIQRFDISNFRYINEAYGHMRADDLLKACVDIYQEIYSDKELCVRMDSDQFLTLTVNDSEVNERRSTYCQKLNAYANENGIKYPIRLKFGIYQIRKQDNDIDVMIDHANVAKRANSGNEADGVAYYTDAIIRNMYKVDKIESEMQGALDTGEFKVYLQAKWDIQNDRVAGAEALVRWIKPDGNMVYPDEFIPVFEQNGFIEKLDFYMLEMVCKQIHQVLTLGGKVYPVSINQSRILLHSPDYIEHVTQVLEQYQVPRNCIELEVTETTLFDDKERMIEILNNLKSENIQLSMDDFGSGYSSLNILKDMPFDVLKIDREFFSESITSKSSILILQKIIEMADGLGIEVICEGVETKQQIELLKAIGCKRVQGYYYARPVPAEEYIKKYCQIPR